MKKIYLLFILLMSVSISAQTISKDDIQIKDRNIIVTDDGMLVISFDMILSPSLKISSSEMMSITPYINDKKGKHVMLPSVYVYGHKRYIVHKRENMLPIKPFDIIYRENGKTQKLNYLVRENYIKWMNGAEISIDISSCGCANRKGSESDTALGIINKAESYKPYIAFITPDIEDVKKRNVCGSAFIDYPVSKAIIYPDFRNNHDELKKINTVIDEVNNDSNITIKNMSIIGYASPEGSYKLNKNLSQARAESLKKYIIDRYRIASNMIQVSSVAEDWKGVLKYVQDNPIEMKSEIIGIINDKLINDDQRDKEIKDLNWQVYKQLLSECYPALRRSDYQVNYTVKDFDLVEAKQVFETHPQQLSLDEMYRLAKTYKEGSSEFTNVFLTAARLFPSDNIANLNAAAAQLMMGNTIGATHYLDRCEKNTPEVLNNYGVLMTMEKKYQEAKSFFQKAVNAGSKQAEDNLKELENLYSDKL